MIYMPSCLYSKEFPDLRHKLTGAIAQGLARRNGPSIIFFRADDIGVLSQPFQQMMLLFHKYAMPLNLAVVPAWLTASRWQKLQCFTSTTGLFCWHQHGWRHANHETAGRKQEFGDSREIRHLEEDLLRGRQRLASLMGNHFLPLFTPPWNRCGAAALSLLEEHGYLGISRNHGALPPAPSGLVEIPINIDLHTRREENADSSLDVLLLELQDAVASGAVGIMLHHQRMNDNAFILLEQLLVVSRQQELVPRSFGDILSR